MIRYAVVAVIFMVSGCRQVNTKPSQKIENASQFNAFSAEKDDKNKAAVVYISKNKGTNWQPFSDGIPDEATVSCFIEKGNKIYAATEYHGVFINDGAKTWYSANNKLPKDIKIKALEYANDTLVLGSSNYGIWLSPDEGKTWQPTINEWIKTPVRCLFYHQNRLFSGTDNGIFVSFDNGLSWKKNFTTVQVNGFVAFQNNLYAGLANGAVMSNNSGATWRYIYTPNTLHDISHDAESVYALTLGEGL
ncbi:MAG: hypothetical protein HC817_06665 [Saprospiraceae bacterium]|nr:hypothetical protein [Saprospiraceae bacterium]